MKKKILFIMNNLNCGGAEKALISLLENFDFNEYTVDLLLFKHEGIFMNSVPPCVNLLPEPENYKYFDMPIKLAIRDLIKKGRFDIALARLKSIYIFKTEKNRVMVEQKVWKHLSKSFDSLNKDYDIAIGYLEKNPTYFCVDKVKAKIKIGWIHNDYEKLGMDKTIDNHYFNELGYIFTVSQECLNVLKSIFPQYKNKFKLMHNLISHESIQRLALEKVQDIEFPLQTIKIASIGRLTYQKGFEIAIEACSILKERGYSIQWIVLGEGEDRGKLEQLIKEYRLQDSFYLLGIKENPYPYVFNSDIYVQPSRFEGKSIAIDEAKILHKPIIVTNFSTAKDQIIHGVNGLISDMNGLGIADLVEGLITDKYLKNQLVNNLIEENPDNETELKKLYELI